MVATNEQAMVREKRSVLTVKNPATGELLGELPLRSAEEARQIMERAKAAQPAWEKLGLAARCRIMLRFTELLEAEAEPVARLLSQENGKPIHEALANEVLPILNLTRYFAKNAANILKPQPIKMSLYKHRRSYLHFRPRGVVLVISPWNYPLYTPGAETVMSLIAGNTVVLKPASFTPLIAVKFHELMLKAGVPADVFQVCVTSGAVASAMVEMGTNFVNFTGSTAVGKKVAEVCGRNLVPCAMELGGKAPALVLADADLDLAVNALTWGAFANAGQICASIERVYAHESVYDELVKRVVAKVSRLRVGEPLSHNTDIGALTDPDQLEIVAQQVEEARRQGATIQTGGQRQDGTGQFYPPTVVTNLDESFALAREESFGPILPIMKVRDDEEAIRRANDTNYGLTAYVYSSDGNHARAVAERIEAGTVTINEAVLSVGLPETPWGGVKDSGVGIVHSDEGLRQLCVAYHIHENVLPPLKDNPLIWFPYSPARYRRVRGVVGLLFGASPLRKLKGLFGLIKG